MMNNFPIPIAGVLKQMTLEETARVRAAEIYLKSQPQKDVPINHFIHAGMYQRSCIIPANVMITGALIKIPTILIVSGDCGVWLGNQFIRVTGYKIFKAPANRKQIFIAKVDTTLTMLFPTSAKTVREAEEQFTDEAHLLQSREAQTPCQQLPPRPS